MDQAQFEVLIQTLWRIAERLDTYTLTGAADWPILAAMGALIVGLIAYMWHDLKTTMRYHGVAMELIERRCRDFAEKEDDKIWGAMRDCQADCCRKERHPHD